MLTGGCPALASTLPRISDTILAAKSACGSMHPKAPEDRTTVNTGNSITLTVTLLNKHNAKGATFHATDLSELPVPAIDVRCGCSCCGGTGGTCGHPESTVPITEGARLPCRLPRRLPRRLSPSRGAVIALSWGVPKMIAPSRGVPTLVSQKLLVSARASLAE